MLVSHRIQELLLVTPLHMLKYLALQTSLRILSLDLLGGPGQDFLLQVSIGPSDWAQVHQQPSSSLTHDCNSAEFPRIRRRNFVNRRANVCKAFSIIPSTEKELNGCSF